MVELERRRQLERPWLPPVCKASNLMPDYGFVVVTVHFLIRLSS